MMDILDLFLDALLDCLRLVPFLLATLAFMEYLEHRAAGQFERAIARAGNFGPVVGAALGCVPQCGFSAACSQLFNGGLISAGTLVAVYLSTSDEALPILLASPGQWKNVGLVILVKVVIAVVTGFVLDRVWRVEQQKADYVESAIPHSEVCHSDGKWSHLLLSAVKRMLGILLFIFLVSFLLNLGIAAIGEERIGKMLLPGPLQPFLAALVGLIPNCASSVLLTQLYLEGLISFGSVIAGLSTAMGIGLLVLLKGRRKPRTYAIVLGTTYASAVLFGSIFQLIF